MRDQGFSVREIAEQTGLSKTFVHDLSRGKRRVSTERAGLATERLLRQGGMRIITDGTVGVRTPLRKRDRSKIGKYWNVLERARRRGDYTIVRKSLTRAQLTVRTAEGVVILETDPALLRELDDAGMLTPDEILLGESS